LAAWCCTLSRVTAGDLLASLLPATQAVVAERHQSVGQNGEGLVALPAESAPNPDALAAVVVRVPQAPSVADDRVVPTDRTPARQAIQRNYPGSLLSFSSGSAIKRIRTGVKARSADRPRPKF